MSPLCDLAIACTGLRKTCKRIRGSSHLFEPAKSDWSIQRRLLFLPFVIGCWILVALLFMDVFHIGGEFWELPKRVANAIWFLLLGPALMLVGYWYFRRSLDSLRREWSKEVVPGFRPDQPRCVFLLRDRRGELEVESEIRIRIDINSLARMMLLSKHSYVLVCLSVLCMLPITVIATWLPDDAWVAFLLAPMLILSWIAATIAAYLAMVRPRRGWRRLIDKHKCPMCAYHLVAFDSEHPPEDSEEPLIVRCPECGTRVARMTVLDS